MRGRTQLARTADETRVRLPNTRPPQRHYKALNRQITCLANGGDVRKLLTGIDDLLQQMNGLNLATALHRMAKLAVSGQEANGLQVVKTHPVFVEVLGRIESHVLNHSAGAKKSQSKHAIEEEMPVQSMSIVAWSCANLQVCRRPLLMALADIASRNINDFQPYELSNLLWAYAKLSLHPSDLLASVSKRLMTRQRGEIKVQCLSTIAWSFATLGCQDATVFASLSYELRSFASVMKPLEISNSLWAFAKNRFQDQELFKTLGDAAAQDAVASLFSAQEMSSTVWAFATVGLQHPELFSQIGIQCILRREQLTPQGISNILWSFAKLQVPTDPDLFKLLLDRAMKNLDGYKPEELSALAWAAAQQCPDNTAFLEKAAATCVKRLSEFSSNATANFVKVFSSIRVKDTEHFMIMLRQVTHPHKLSQLRPPALSSLLRGTVVAILNGDYVPHKKEIQDSVCTICRQVETCIEQLRPPILQEMVVSLRMCQGIECCSHLLHVISSERSRWKNGHKAASRSIASVSTADEDAFVIGLHGQETDHCAGNTSGDKSIASAPPGLEETRAVSRIFGNVELSSSDLSQAMSLPDRSGNMSQTLPTPAYVGSAAHHAVPSDLMPWSVPLPAMRELPSFKHFDFVDLVKKAQSPLSGHPPRWGGGTLSQWCLWRRRAGWSLPVTTIAKIMHNITVEAESLISSGLFSLSSIDPDEIVMGVDDVPHLQTTSVDQPNSPGHRLKWLSPEEAAGHVVTGDTLWLAVSFRLGLLLHCLGCAGSFLDPHPERSAEEVFLGLFHEVQGSGPAFRPDVTTFTGPDILKHLVVGCLRIGQEAPPPASTLTAVFECVAAWPS